MKGKSLLLVLSAVLLTGCGSSSSSSQSEEKTLYSGLSGKETYIEAVKYINENVTYYQSEATDSNSHTYTQYYRLDDGIGVVTKALYEDGESTSLNYNIAYNKDYHTLFMIDSESYKYNVIHDYTGDIKTMYTDISIDKNYDILDVERKDQDGQIILTMKVKQIQYYQENDTQPETVYYINEIKINKDGYICEEKITNYTNEEFKDVSFEGLSIQYSQFNEKKKEDFQKEIEIMESCDGLNDIDVKEKIGV